MRTLELLGHVDEQHRLCIDVPADVTPGPVKVILTVADPDNEERAWEHAINEDWSKDWSDPREDIYTLEEGKAVERVRTICWSAVN